MTNKKTIRNAAMAAASFFTLGLFSCQKENSIDPPQAAQPALKQFTSGDEQIKFDYNADKSLRTVTVKNESNAGGEGTVYTVKYLPNKKLDELSGNTGIKIKLLYSNGILSKAETYEANQKVSVVDYEFLNGLLKSSVIKMIDNNTAVPFLKFAFTYNAAGNISRTDTWNFDPATQQLQPSGYMLTEYDNRPNPFATVNDVMMVLWQVATRNNVTRQTYFSKTGQQTEQTTYAYTYNSRQYPVSAVVSTTAPGQQPVSGTVGYSYQQ